MNFKPKPRPNSHGRRAQRSKRPTPNIEMGMTGIYRGSKLGPYKVQLREWFALELSFDEILQRLAKHKVKVSKQALSQMRKKLQREHLQEIVLDRIASGAAAHSRVVKELGENPAPDTQTLIALVQNLIFTMATKGQHLFTASQLSSLLRPVLEWSRLQLKERETSVAERKVALLEDAAAKAREAEGVVGNDKLSQEEKLNRMREIFGIQPGRSTK